MKTYIQGRDGMITGFKMEWTFDPMTSAYMLDGEDMSPNYAQKTLRILVQAPLWCCYLPIWLGCTGWVLLAR